MLGNTSRETVLKWWLMLGAAAVLVTLLYEAIRWIDPVDFYVYYYAAETALRGGEVYAEVVRGPELPDGLPYNYGPAGIILFLALLLAPINWAFLIWTAVQILLLSWLIRRLLPTSARPILHTLMWLGVFVPSTILAQQSLWGQINIVLMAFCLGGAFLWHGAYRPWLHGVLVGLATAIKLTPGLFLLFFLAAKRWKAFLWSLIGGAISTGIAALFFFDHTSAFFEQTLFSLTDRVSLGENFATSGNNSIQGAAAFLGAPSAVALTGVVVIAVLGILAALRVDRALGIVPAVITIGLLSPLLSPVSWIHHFVFILPAIVYLFYRSGRGTRILLAVMVALLWMQATDLGHWLLETELSALAPLGLLLRQGLLLMSLGLILLLWLHARTPHGARARPEDTARSAASTEPGQHPHPATEVSPPSTGLPPLKS